MRYRAALAAPLRAARALAAAHPRHVLLAAIVAGLLAGPRWPPVLAAVALALIALAPDAMLALGAVAALLAGATVATVRLAALDATALTSLVGGEVDVRAVLLEHPRERSSGTRVAAVALRSGPGSGERVLLRAGAYVAWPERAEPGVELAVRGRLRPLGRFEAYERRRNSHAVLQARTIGATGRRRGGLPGLLDGVRSRTERALTSGLPAPQGALARGMVLGQDGALTTAIRDDFRVTGLAHLVAASGANVLLLATLVLAIATAAGLGLTARLWLAIALVAAYVPLAGGGPSIQRAGMMGVAGLVAALAGRPSSRWYALLLAAALTLIANPRAAEDPGWQLSFVAVLAMLALVPALSARLRRRRVPRGLAEAFAVTAAATLGTAPLIALHFERLSLVSLPVNVLAAAAVAPVMWLGTIAGALGQFAPWLARPVAELSAFPLAYLTWLAHAAARLPFAQLQIGSPGPWGVAATYAAAGAGALGWPRIARRIERRRELGARRRWPRGHLWGRRADDPRHEPGARRWWLRAGLLGRRADDPHREPAARRWWLRAGLLGRRADDPRHEPGARGPVGRRALAALAAAAAAVALLLAARPPAPPRDLTVSFLDIGQGDATLIQHGRAAVLVDTGPPGGPILERLRDAGVRRLDLLVATHAALDHDGAAAAVMDAVPVGLLLDGEEGGVCRSTGASGVRDDTPPASASAGGPFGARATQPIGLLAARRHVPCTPSDAGQVLRVGPLELRVLWPHREPAAPPGAEPNDRATVIHLRDGAFDLLLTADAESNVTSALDLPAVDALKVAHHGSDDPGTPALLRRLHPRVAVISVGARNLYGHPTPATVAALRAAVPIVRRTDRDGTVRLRVHDGRMTVEREP
ncbi:MAG: competence protein ComEC [Solirubrobacteraceae bacterium]|nr:competence protein ComEC [Solirubrobacteraceae bacterium]